LLQERLELGPLGGGLRERLGGLAKLVGAGLVAAGDGVDRLFEFISGEAHDAFELGGGDDRDLELAELLLEGGAESLRLGVGLRE
jgi:hypothetical protein